MRRWFVMESLRKFAMAATVCALFGAVSAQDAAKSAPEPIDRHLTKIRRSISNAQVKLPIGASEFSQPGTRTDLSPAWACCSRNLKRIEKSVVAVQSMLTQLEYCYEDAGLSEELIAGRLAQSDLQALAKTVQQFADAKTMNVAKAALEGVTRTYLNLSDTSAELAECGELLDPSLVEVSESETEGESARPE